MKGFINVCCICVYFIVERQKQGMHIADSFKLQSRRACRFDFIEVLRKVYLPRKIDIKF